MTTPAPANKAVTTVTLGPGMTVHIQDRLLTVKTQMFSLEPGLFPAVFGIFQKTDRGSVHITSERVIYDSGDNKSLSQYSGSYDEECENDQYALLDFFQPTDTRH